ncbi:MAG: cell division protein ZapA [Microvirga sp.]
MSHVSVTIAGHSYRIACGEGEERRLDALATLVDGRIEEMRRSFGEIGDMRLHVMAAIAIADEMTETRNRIAALEAELAKLRDIADAGDERSQLIEARFAQGIAQAAERIAALARSLGPGAA